MKSIFQNKSIVILLLAFIILLVPTLFLGWSLVDDGKSAQISYELSNAITKMDLQSFFRSLLEPESGRFRPGYWIYLWLTFLIAGNNAFIHHVFHLLLFLLSSYLIYSLTKKLSSITSVGILSIMFFLFDSKIIENWYRLGTQEPITLPLLLGSLYIFINSKKDSNMIKLFLATLLGVIALYVKETNLAYLVIPTYILVMDIFLQKKKDIKFNLLYLVVLAVFTVITRAVSSTAYGIEGYASLYEINTNSIINNLTNYITMIRTSYSPLLEILLLLLFTRVWFNMKNKGFIKTLKAYYWHVLWFVWFTAFFVIQIPWGFTIGRYLLIAMVGLHILLAESFVVSLSFIRNFLNIKQINKRLDFKVFFELLKVSLLVLLPFTFLYHFIMSVNYIYWVSAIDRFNVSFIETLVKRTPQNGRVYLNAEHTVNPPIELYYEIDWHFDYLYSRSDILYDYLKPDTELKTGDIVAFHTAAPLRVEEDFINKEYTLIAENNTDASNLIVTSTMGFVKNLLRASISGFNSLNVNSLVATSANNYRWVIYQVK